MFTSMVQPILVYGLYTSEHDAMMHCVCDAVHHSWDTSCSRSVWKIKWI